MLCRNKSDINEAIRRPMSYYKKRAWRTPEITFFGKKKKSNSRNFPLRLCNRL